MNVTIESALTTFVEEQVKAGRYTSAEAAVNAAAMVVTSGRFPVPAPPTAGIGRLLRMSDMSAECEDQGRTCKRNGGAATAAALDSYAHAFLVLAALGVIAAAASVEGESRGSEG